MPDGVKSDVCSRELNPSVSRVAAVSRRGDGSKALTQRATTVDVTSELCARRIRFLDFLELNDPSALGLCALVEDLGEYNLPGGLEELN